MAVAEFRLTAVEFEVREHISVGQSHEVTVSVSDTPSVGLI